MFEQNEKKCDIWILFIYHGNTLKISICPWIVFFNLKIQKTLYSIILFVVAETAAIASNLY